MATERRYVHDRYLDAEERYEILVVKAAERPHLVRWSADDRPEDGDKFGGGGDDRDDDDDDEKKVDDGIARQRQQGAQDPPSRASRSSSARTTEQVPDRNTPPPPLTDGCDLPGWRRHRIAPCMNPSHEGDDAIDVESPLEGTLNIGAGSSLMRRESQFPFVSSRLCGGSSSRDDDSDECWWHLAKRRFDVPPPPKRAAAVIDHVDAARMVDHPKNWDNSNVGRNRITMFCREYEIKNRPVKILGATEGWSAMPRYKHGNESDDGQSYENIKVDGWRDVGESSELFSGGGEGGWTFANLLSRFGNVSFRFSDTHGEMMSLGTYAKYMTNPEGLSDDSPLGIYDSEFGDDDSPTNALLDEYSVPQCFSMDLFDFVDDGRTIEEVTDITEEGDGESGSERSVRSVRSVQSLTSKTSDSTTISRPPYRWILIGPGRSGTGMHVDPLWTNAWVTVLQGRKRWLLFPPDTPHADIGMVEDEPQIPSSIWFRDYYDRVTSPSWPEEYRPAEVLQNPGETVYVPAGWPHLVLNLELTVAVTHNYASEHGPFFGRMWEETAKDEPDFATRWFRGLKRGGREDLARAAPPEVAERARPEEH